MNSCISFFPLIFLLQSCANHGQLKLIEKLSQKLKENSGIVSYSDSTAWFIEGKGNIIQQFDVKMLHSET